MIESQYGGFNKNAGKFKSSYKMIKRLINTESNIDNSEKYIAELNKVLKHRGQDISMAPKFASILKYNDR
jgi:hypothetical protein